MGGDGQVHKEFAHDEESYITKTIWLKLSILFNQSSVKGSVYLLLYDNLVNTDNMFFKFSAIFLVLFIDAIMEFVVISILNVG